MYTSGVFLLRCPREHTDLYSNWFYLLEHIGTHEGLEHDAVWSSDVCIFKCNEIYYRELSYLMPQITNRDQHKYDDLGFKSSENVSNSKIAIDYAQYALAYVNFFFGKL